MGLLQVGVASTWHKHELACIWQAALQQKCKLGCPTPAHYMTLSFHPEAARRFDELATQLAAQVDISLPPTQDPGPPSEPPFPVAASLTDADLTGEPVWEETNQDLLPVARHTGRKGKIYSLRGEAHLAYRRLAERLHSTKPFAQVAAFRSVAALLFTWLIEKASGASMPPLSTYLLTSLKGDLVRQTLIMPVFELFVPGKVTLGEGYFAPLSGNILDGWERKQVEWASGLSDQLTARFQDFRMKAQGRAAYWIDVEAEPAYANEYAILKADEAVAILRLFSRGMFQPLGRSYVTRLGMEALQKSQVHRMREGEYFGATEALVSPPPFEWGVDFSAVAPLLPPFHDLLLLDEPSKFQEDLKDALMMYSRAALYENVSEKLIHIFAALESFLLRNDTEPIVSALCDRIAFLVGRTAEARLDIAKNVRATYNLRSRFIHHGAAPLREPETLDALRTFMVNASTVFLSLAAGHNRYSVRDELFDAIERRKYA